MGLEERVKTLEWRIGILMQQFEQLKTLVNEHNTLITALTLAVEQLVARANFVNPDEVTALSVIVQNQSTTLSTAIANINSIATEVPAP